MKDREKLIYILDKLEHNVNNEEKRKKFYDMKYKLIIKTDKEIESVENR